MRDRIGLREAAMRIDFQVIALLAIAVIFGAGGAGFGLNNLIVQLCAILILAANYPAMLHFARSAPRLLVALVLVSLALPVLHAIPLPPSVWQALPGRDIVIESLTMIGKQDGWFPLSLDRGRTIGAVVALLPPLAVLVLAFALERKSICPPSAFNRQIGCIE